MDRRNLNSEIAKRQREIAALQTKRRMAESDADYEKSGEVQAKIVELRFFGGLSIEEVAHVLKISPTTVKREWTIAKAWFQRELSREH